MGWGLMGVALGSAAALALVAFYCTFYALRLLDLSVVPWFKEGCFRALLCGVPLAGFLAFLRRTWEPANLAMVFLQFALGSLVYAATVWRLGLRTDERGQLLALLAKAWNRVRGGSSS